MARPTLAQIRTGIQARLATVSGLHAYDRWPDRVDFPAAVVMLASERQDTMGTQGSMGLMLAGRVIVLAGPPENGYADAQAKLDALLDVAGTDVWDAIEADIDLGALACTISVTGWDSYSAKWECNGGEAFGAAVNFEVYR